MENSNPQFDAKLEIAFPKSSEDHRLQLVSINDAIFAIVHSPLKSQGPIRLDCEEWSLILLAPIQSKTDIDISAINIISLNEIQSEEGIVNIHASNRLLKFAHATKSPESVNEVGEHGKFQFEDDPGAFLNYYRLFEGIVNNVFLQNPDSFSEAQQKFIMALCGLANKFEQQEKNLDLYKVLKIWDIPILKS